MLCDVLCIHQSADKFPFALFQIPKITVTVQGSFFCRLRSNQVYHRFQVGDIVRVQFVRLVENIEDSFGDAKMTGLNPGN